MRIVAATVLTASLVACSGSQTGQTAQTALAGDLNLLIERLEAIHPDPYHAISEADFQAAADRLAERGPRLDDDEVLVELMRLTALFGERDGHAGVFPLDPSHDRTLHLYPIRVYEFSDGFFVVDAIGRPELVGSRLSSIGGRPIADLVATVRPLVPRDNELSRKARVAQYLVVHEVLRGLGVSSAEFELDGQPVTLEPIEAEAYVEAFPDLFQPQVPQGLPRRPKPAYLAGRLRDRWIERLPGAVYGAYNVTLGDPTRFADALTRGRGPVILDVRHNPGGDNGTYPPLLEALRGREVIVLTSRTTFSAAVNFITELEQTADVTFVGEPTGGALNFYSDPVGVALPATGLTVQLADVYWQKSTPDDPRLAIEPDVPVELSSEHFFAGHDPVLAAAVRRALR
jgi:hypothetical protein